MKKYVGFSAVGATLLLLCTSLFSFSPKRGGDIFEIYLNGKQVHQQFVHVDKRVKTIELSTFNDKDRIDVLYSHCGHAGTKRVLTLRNEKGELVSQLKFPDVNTSRSLMRFYRTDVAKGKGNKMSLYYSSTELPEPMLLAAISWKDAKSIVRL
ncbi:MAG TPA: hypothetical protein VM871_10540 [Flavisolibacter sp.]|nr:hypothetical protein [Flavisolibacter sp.]